MLTQARMARMLVAVSLVLVACSSGGGGSSAKRPSTAARLEIVSPTPSEVTGPNVNVKFNLIGATILPPDQVTGPLRGDQGHIHLRLDGAGVQMAYGPEMTLNNLTPGPHTIVGEFVATDHQPFTNRPTTAVVFQVKS